MRYKRKDQLAEVHLTSIFDLVQDVVSGGFAINDGVMQPTGGAGLGVKVLGL